MNWLQFVANIVAAVCVFYTGMAYGIKISRLTETNADRLAAELNTLKDANKYNLDKNEMLEKENAALRKQVEKLKQTNGYYAEEISALRKEIQDRMNKEFHDGND